MPRINSVEDLKKLKEQALDKIAVRLQGEDIDSLTQIYVGMDESGMQAGAKEVFHHIWSAVSGKPVVVLQTAKIGDFKEPAIKVVRPGQHAATVFEGVTIDKANEVISEFVEKGNPIEGMIAATHE
ncbi:hypothetical protein EII17_04790 [Clostridiales bacterium COT073_COT-073]|nr:hypothetical protein EII17_04790 [Clostridiales bacterium COT073_COT-073]